MNERNLAVEIATAGDAAWFAKESSRRLRIRNMVPGEFPDVTGPAPVGMAWRTIVLEAQPGARSRQAIALPIGTSLETLDDDALYALFVQVAPAGARAVIARLRKLKCPTPRPLCRPRHDPRTAKCRGSLVPAVDHDARWP